jgi:hypothetical protein
MHHQIRNAAEQHDAPDLWQPAAGAQPPGGKGGQCAWVGRITRVSAFGRLAPAIRGHDAVAGGTGNARSRGSAGPLVENTCPLSDNGQRDNLMLGFIARWF